MRFKHHEGHPPPSSDVIASVALLLRGKELTDACQFEHQTDFHFGEIELAVEGPWRLETRDEAVVVGEEGGQLVDESERARINEKLESLLRGRVVADLAINHLGDLEIQFLRGERLSAFARPSGLLAWVLEAGRRSYFAEWGGLVEKTPKPFPDKDGFWRILRGG